LLFLTVILNTL